MRELFRVKMPLTADLTLRVEDTIGIDLAHCLRIEGYAVTWDVDTVNRIFTKDSIKCQKNTPLFLEHNINMDIGVLTDSVIDHIGLYVVGYIDTTYPGIDRIKNLFDKGHCLNLSIAGFINGYSIDDGIMIIDDYDLIEVSLVSHPINKYAVVTHLH